jgi:hypothetical protein
MKRLSTLLFALVLAVATAETRSVTVDVDAQTGRPVPVSIDLLSLRDAIGAEFTFAWESIRVMVDGEEVPYQIDDIDLNERISAGDELSFLATGPAEIQVSSDTTAANYEAALTVHEGETTVIEGDNGFRVEVPPSGLVRIVGFEGAEDMLADELGILRFSGYPESTYWADGQLGPHEEYTTLEEGGMRHVRTEVLPVGPARVTVVSDYSSERFVGLEQRVVARVYATGDVTVSNEIRFRGYSDMMKLQHMATRVMSQADPDSLHLMPPFRRLAWADQLDISPEEYFAEREAVTEVEGSPYLEFRADDNLSPLYWGATYIFASAEPWRAGYSPSLGLAVAELVHETPEIAEDYSEWFAGDTWAYESQELRTGVFKWTPGEFAAYDVTAGVPDSEPNHYLPGDMVTFRATYSVYPAGSSEDAIRWADQRQAELASVTLGH